MSTMPIRQFMERFSPSNEGTTEVSGTWMEELSDQIVDPEANHTLVELISEFRLAARRGVTQPLLEPVLVDFNPDRIHDGHSRVLALWITGYTDIFYGVQP